MANSKTYLNVPYTEKDTAKALGAKWDASKKKWYAPDSLDIILFERWDKKATLSSAGKTKSQSLTGKPTLGTVTHAKDKSFVAYSGDLPPWLPLVRCPQQ